MSKRQLAWDIRLETGDKAGEPFDQVLSIYDTVVSPGMAMFGGVTAEAVHRELRAKRKAESILVRINSGGGSVTEGFAIYNLLMESPAKVTTRVDGLAGSIASIILMAGQEREIARNAVVMIHNPFAMVEGEASELRALANLLDMHAAQMLSIYASRTGQSVEKVKALCDATTWMSAAEAVALGFCTGIMETEARMAASLRPEDFGSAPEHVKRLFAAGEPNAMKTRTAAQANITAESVAKEAAELAAAEAEAKAAAEAAEAEAKAKAEADAQAEVASLKAALAAKEGELASLQAEFKKFKEEEEEEDDEESKALARVVQVAKELTGKADLAEVEGALMALADQPKADPAKEHEARVEALVKDGKLPPARRAWALTASPVALDTFLQATGGMRLVPSANYTPDDKAARDRAGLDPDKVELTPAEIHVAKLMNRPLDETLKAKRLALTGTTGAN